MVIIILIVMIIALFSMVFGVKERFGNIEMDPKMKWLKSNTKWYSKPLTFNKTKWCGFDRVYFITLPDRLKNVKSIAKRMGIQNVWFLKAIDKYGLNKELSELYEMGLVDEKYGNGKDSRGKDNLGRMACHLSHLACIRHFLDSKDGKCVIFEDDLQMPEPLTRRETETFHNEVDNYNWNILYLGYCYESGSEPIMDNVQRLKKPLCRHAYALTRNGAEIIMKNTLPQNDNGDQMYRKLIESGELRAYGPRKMRFLQNRGDFKTTLHNYHPNPPQYASEQTLKMKFEHFAERIRNAFKLKN